MKKFLFLILTLICVLCLLFSNWAHAQIVVNNGDVVKNPTLTGTSCIYKWIPDQSIGMPIGQGLSIPDFTAINPGTVPVTAKVNVVMNMGDNMEIYYVINQLSGRVWAIPPTGPVIITDSDPYAMVANLLHDHFYITNKTAGTVTVARYTDQYTLVVIATITVGKGAEGIVMSPDGSTIYVANSIDNSVSVIDTKTNSVKATIAVAPVAPTGVAVSPDGKKLYVTCAGSAVVSVINTGNNAVTGTIPVGSGPSGMVISPDGGTLYVSNQGSNTVSVINTATNAVSPVSVGNSPLGIAISRDGTRVYVANQGSNNVSAINTTAGNAVTNINVGTKPTGLSVSPKGDLVYVANYTSNDVSVINTATNTVQSTVEGDNLGGHGPDNTLVTGPSGCMVPFTYTITINPTPPTIKVSGSVPPLTTSMGAPSVSGSFTVSALSLTTAITATAPAGYEVSTDNVNFSNTATVGAAGNVASTTVYVRLAPSAPMGIVTGNIILSSGAASRVSEPVSGTITAAAPAITVGLAYGKIKGCEGVPSTSVQQFLVSAVDINGALTATAPNGFEVSKSPTDGFAAHIDISTSNNVPNTAIYVRSSGAVVGNVSGNVMVSAPGVFPAKTVAVLGIVYPSPTVNPVASQVVVAGGPATKPVMFTGTGNTYNWFNDTPGIGLDPSGTGNIASFAATNKTDNDILATITAIPVSTTLAYITNQGANTVSVVNVSTNVLIATIAVGASPQAILLSADATRAYVADHGSNDVSVINTGTNQVIATIKVGQEPQGLEFSPDGSILSVYNSFGNTVTTINTATNTAIGTSDLTGYLPGSVRSPDGSLAYVFDGMGFGVYNTATNALVGALPGDGAPCGLAISPDGSIIYTPVPTGEVYVIDASTYKTITIIPLGAGVGPRGVSITPDGTLLYVAGGNNNTISVINTATYEVVATLTADHFPFAAATTGGTGCSGNATTFTITVKPVPPTITANGTLASLSTVQGNPSATTTFTVSGIRMQAGITVGPLAGFEFSTDNVNFSSILVVGAVGTIATTTVYVRLAASDGVGNYTGNINLSSLNATTVIVATDGTNNVYEPVSTIQTAFISGIITACAGNASVSPAIKQFTTNGFKLSAPITVSAPGGFEVSLSASSGYTGSLSLSPDGLGTVNPVTIYVRSAATAPAGTYTDKVTLSTTGATNQYIPVTEVISPLPSVTQIADITTAGDQAVNAINFTGTANTYSWVNDKPAIGFSASGYGSIPAFTAVNKGGTQLVANVTVTPIAAALAYVANSNSASVSVINTGSGAVVATITVGSTPMGVAVSPDGRRVYVANQGPGTISVIDAISNTVSGTINLGPTKRPVGIVISPDGGTLYTVNSGSNDVSIVNIATGAITNITVGIGPDGIIISPDGGTIYVANRNVAITQPGNITKGISVINTATNAVTSLNTGRSVLGLAISADGSEIYETNYSDNTVWAINVATGAADAKINVGTSPAGIAISRDGKTLYVANGGSNNVSMISTASNTVTGTLTVGTNPQGVAASPDGSVVYVANAGSANVSVIQTISNTVTATVTVGNTPVSYGSFISTGLGCTGTSMKFKISVNPTSPFITPAGALVALSTTYGTPSASTSFSVSGISMSAAIVATAPAGFEVSLDNKTFSSRVSFGAAGVIASTTVYVRLAATAQVGTYPGTITLSSTGAADTPEPIPASTVNTTGLTITADNKTKTAGAANPVLTASYSGFVNGDTPASLTTQPTLSTTATQSSPPGQYPIDISGAASTNYTFTYVAGVLTVNLGEQQLAIPNAFTANGDGINDTWEIPALTTYTNFTVSIFNRQGQNLYYSNNYPTPWDGTYKGSPLPTGVYYYIINIKGASKPLSGNVTIIR